MTPVFGGVDCIHLLSGDEVSNFVKFSKAVSMAGAFNENFGRWTELPPQDTREASAYFSASFRDSEEPGNDIDFNWSGSEDKSLVYSLTMGFHQPSFTTGNQTYASEDEVWRVTLDMELKMTTINPDVAPNTVGQSLNFYNQRDPGHSIRAVVPDFTTARYDDSKEVIPGVFGSTGSDDWQIFKTLVLKHFTGKYWSDPIVLAYIIQSGNPSADNWRKAPYDTEWARLRGRQGARPFLVLGSCYSKRVDRSFWNQVSPDMVDVYLKQVENGMSLLLIGPDLVRQSFTSLCDTWVQAAVKGIAPTTSGQDSQFKAVPGTVAVDRYVSGGPPFTFTSGRLGASQRHDNGNNFGTVSPEFDVRFAAAVPGGPPPFPLVSFSLFPDVYLEIPLGGSRANWYGATFQASGTFSLVTNKNGEISYELTTCKTTGLPIGCSPPDKTSGGTSDKTDGKPPRKTASEQTDDTPVRNKASDRTCETWKASGPTALAKLWKKFGKKDKEGITLFSGLYKWMKSPCAFAFMNGGFIAPWPYIMSFTTAGPTDGVDENGVFVLSLSALTATRDT